MTAARPKHAGHATAHKVRTVRASPHAAQPPCPHFGPCGGCQHQNLQYTAQLAEKQAQVGLPLFLPFHLTHFVKLIQTGGSLLSMQSDTRAEAV
jgi:hypothetical protein